LDYFCIADVDECATDSHQCNPTQICINTEGGYTCSCTDGYWLLEGQCLGKSSQVHRDFGKLKVAKDTQTGHMVG
jgi:hypothetical protein